VVLTSLGHQESIEIQEIDHTLMRTEILTNNHQWEELHAEEAEAEEEEVTSAPTATDLETMRSIILGRPTSAEELVEEIQTIIRENEANTLNRSSI
jgi:hypothetical protein